MSSDKTSTITRRPLKIDFYSLEYNISKTTKRRGFVAHKVVLMTVAMLLPLAASSNVVGGVEHIHVKLDDSSVKFAAVAMNTYLRDKDHQNHEALEVIEATSQVVEGILYYFKIKMSDVPINQICTIKVWEEDWRNPVFQKIGVVKCKDENNLGEDYHNDYQPYAELLGGVTPANFSNHFVQNALKPVTDRANLESTSQYRLIPSGEGKVLTQVVAGIEFRFVDMEMKLSDCRKNEQKYTMKECPLQQTQDSVMRNVNATVFWDFKTYTVQYFKFCLSSQSV